MMIRNATLEDLETIRSLNKALFVFDFQHDNTFNCDWPDSEESTNYFRKRITEGSAFVSEVDGVVVGYLIGALVPSESYRKTLIKAELENTLVLEDFRGKGVGKELYGAFLEWAKSKGANRLVVVASAGNDGAIDFYRKQGFKDYNLTLEMDL
jgi:GNAT superfamily N-acetyltransferase